MLFLPKTLCALIDAAAKESSRYSMTAVKLTERDDGGYRAEATDGKKCVWVQEGFHMPSNQDEIRENMAYAVADKEEVKEGLVPADALLKAFRQVPKGERLCVRLEPDRAILVAGNGVSITLLTEGKFPNTDAVLPKEAPVAVVHFLPEVLMPVLKIFATIAPGTPVAIHLPRAEFCKTTGEQIQKPVALTCATPKGIFVDALAMPIDAPKRPTKQTPKIAAQDDEPEEEENEDDSETEGELGDPVGAQRFPVSHIAKNAEEICPVSGPRCRECGASARMTASRWPDEQWTIRSKTAYCAECSGRGDESEHDTATEEAASV